MSSLSYELISLDLDLTLLDADHHISPRNLDAVRRVRELGAQVMITSGRMYYTTLPYQRQLGIDGPTIAYNGAFIKSEGTGNIWLNAGLDVEFARELVDFCAREQLQLNYYYDDVLYIEKANKWADLYNARTGAMPVAVGDLHTLLHHCPTKMLIIDEPAKIIELRDTLGAHFADRAYVTISNAEYLEFMPLGVDKGKALELVAGRLGIAREKVIAFGDAENDIPAIVWAGTGVAMANAKPITQAAADIVAPHHAEDGVAMLLEEIFGLVPTEVK